MTKKRSLKVVLIIFSIFLFVFLFIELKQEDIVANAYIQTDTHVLCNGTYNGSGNDLYRYDIKTDILIISDSDNTHLYKKSPGVYFYKESSYRVKVSHSVQMYTIWFSVSSAVYYKVDSVNTNIEIRLSRPSSTSPSYEQKEQTHNSPANMNFYQIGRWHTGAPDNGYDADRNPPTTFTFTKDSTNPTISGVSDYAFYKTNKAVSFSDSQSGVQSAKYTRASLSGGYPTSSSTSFTSGTSFSDEGKYRVEVIDNVGNKTIRFFTIDKTSPTVTNPNEFNNGSKVTITFSDPNFLSAKYSRNALSSGYPTSAGTSFSSGTSFSDEGWYFIEVADKAGNKTIRKFCIDRINPVVSNPTEFNKVNVAITFSDHSGIGSAKYSRNALSSGYPTSAGANFTTGTSFSIEGRYRIEVVDKAGNKTTRTFCIDKTSPDLQIYGKKSGSSFVLGASADYFVEAYIKSVDHNYSTQNSVKFKQTGSEAWQNYTYYLETVYYDNTKEGLAIVYYTTKQAAANSIIPGLKATIQTKTNWALADYQALIDAGTHAYGAGQQGLASEGADFWLYQSRKSNNKILIYFNLANLNSYIEDINNGDVSAYITTEANQILRVEGEYQLTVYDKAGNFTTKTLFIDKTTPTVQCTVEHEGYTRTIRTIFNNDLYPYKVEYKKPGENWAEVVADRMDMTADNGLWQFRVVDRAGNTSDVYKITFDNVKPILSSNIALNSFVKTQEKVNVTDINHLSFSYKEPGQDWVTISDTFYTGNATNGLWQFKAEDKAGNVSDIYQFTFDNVNPTVTGVLNNVFYNVNKAVSFSDVNLDYAKYTRNAHSAGNPTTSVTSFTTGTSFSEEGRYRIEVADKAGNKTILIFIIDKIAPSITGIENNSFYNTNKNVEFSDDTLDSAKYSMNENSGSYPTSAGTSFNSGTSFSDEGKYFVEVKDKAGNVTTRTFCIDKTAPTVTGVSNNAFYSTNKTIDFGDYNFSYAKYSKNNNSAGNPASSEITFETGASFSDEGRYRIEVADKAGNQSVLVFCIDKTAPTLSGAENNKFYNTNKNISFNDHNLNYAKYSRNNNSAGNPTSSATSFTAGTSFSEEGRYRIEVADKAGNQSVLIFCIDKTAPSITGISDNAFYNVDKIIDFNDHNLNYAKYSRNNNSAGNPTSSATSFTTGTSFSDEGRYRIEVADKAGNKTTRIFCIDKTMPVLSSSVATGAFVNTIKTVSLTDFNHDKLKHLEPGASTWRETTSISIEMTAINGLWKFVAIDKAGNSSEVFEITFDNIKPVLSSNIALNSFVKTQEKVNVTDINHLKFSYKEPGQDWVTITDTFYTGNTTNGLWQFKAEDKAGNVSDVYKYTFDNVNPTVSSSVALNGFTNQLKAVNGADINYQKLQYMEPGKTAWTDVESTIYTYAAINGLWKFRAIDKAGNISEVYQFTFDNINPIIGLRKENSVTLVDGGFTNAGVYFEPTDINFEEIVLYKNVSDEWQLIDHTYTVGTNYYDSRETENIKLFKQRADALQYVVSFENQRVKVKSNWDITVPGIIPENQQDLAIEGMSYYEYTLTTGEVYLFFEISGLNIFITQKANSYIATNSHEVFFDEGFFKVEAFDKAGNMSFKTFTIDTKIPLGAFVELANNAITNKAVVSFRFEKEGVVVKDYVNDSMHVLTAVFEASGQKYRIDLTEEGYHTLVLEDRAGNMSSYQVYIDRTNAVASHLNVVLQDLEYTNKNTYVINIVDDVELFEVKVNGTTKYKSTEDNKKRSFSTSISTELEHSIEITDRAGNIKTYTVVVDRTKPVIAFTGTLTKENTNVYSNTTINTASSDDRAGVLQTSIKNLQTNAITQMQASQSLNVPDGRYLITVKDKAGNIQEYNYIKYTNNDFKNIETIRKQYIIVSYYKVTLPAYIFNRPNMENIAGVYNFKDQTAATEFARTKEFEYRVQKVGTNEWLYVSASNESVSQKYTNLQEMQAVVNMYARRYVSDRIISKEYAGGISGTIVNEPEFIVNTAAVPEFLPGYADFEIYELKHSFVFSLRNTVYGVKGQARLTYLANDHQIKPEVTIEHLPEETIIQSLTRAEHLKQGYYLVEEYDKCKNSFKYLAYIDLEKPTLTTEVTRGDNTKEEIEITQAYVTENLNVMRYLGFRPQSFLDNIDTDFVVCRIEGRNIEKSFIKGDALPNLTFNNGYKGKYLITLYDRSYNILKFEIIIAGESPSWSTSSLSEKTENVRIAFSINDSLNAFQEINIYKISGSGAKVKLTEDSENVLIGAANLYYTFVTGGKYQAEMIDLYGRTTWTRPIFYLKGLPKGILSTADGGLTNRDVVFVFDTKYEAIAYITAGEEKEITTDYLVAIDEVSKTKTLTFIAKEGLDRVPFLIYLYDKADNNTYVEYTFGIDTVMSPIRMEKKNTKEEIVKGGSSNEGVVISYEDSDLVIRYTLNNNNRVYRRGDVLEEDGLYSFELRDIAGNREEFSLYIDTKVRYKIKGNYITLDSGKLLSNESITIEVLEAVSKYHVKNKNIKQDEPFVEDGIYEIYIEDLYGNNVDIVIEIDKVAPVASLVGGTNGRKTKEKVGVQFEEGAEAFLYKSFTLIKQLENNEYIDAEGEYRIVVQDQAGNKTTLTFEIDRTVEASLNIPNMSITTNRVSIISKEDIQMKVLKNGSEIEKATFFTEPGEYKVVLADSVNNTKEMHFLIIDKGFSYLDLPKFKDSKILEVQKDGYIVEHEGFQFKETGKYELKLATNTEEAYTLSFIIDSEKPVLDVVSDKKHVISFRNPNKTDLKGVLYKDGQIIDENFLLSTQLKEPGAYKLVLIDSYGNENSYDFEIKKHINTAGIVGISIACALVLGLLMYGLISKLKIKAH